MQQLDHKYSETSLCRNYSLCPVSGFSDHMNNYMRFRFTPPHFINFHIEEFHCTSHTHTISHSELFLLKTVNFASSWAI